jgi:hypothetical protein
VSDLDSSVTQAQTVFDALLDKMPTGVPWLRELWDMAALTRPGVAVAREGGLGQLVAAETPPGRSDRAGKVYGRTVAPPAAFLRWLLEHPDRMEVRDRDTFGAKSLVAQEWRRRLFSGDEALVAEARDAGLELLGHRLAQRGRNKWWAFEGFTRVDCCLISSQCVVFVEAPRAEADPAASSTLWYPDRRRLWRNVEAAKELAGVKQFGVILAVETADEGAAALGDAARTLEKSCPHLEPDERAELSRHLLGFVTWPAVGTLPRSGS